MGYIKRQFINGETSVVFVGNGFDMHLGMHSSFDNFFKNKCIINDKFIDSTNNVLYVLIYLRFYCQHKPQSGFFRKIDTENVNWMDVESFIKKIATDLEMKSNLYDCYVKSFIHKKSPGLAFGSDYKKNF